MQILYQVDTVTRQLRIEQGKRRMNMRHHVTAVIQDNIRHTKLSCDLAQESFIGLIADTNLNLVLDEFLTLGPQIDPHDPGVRAQKPLPHLQRPALATAYLEENHIGINELREVTLISGKIMFPLVNQTLIVCKKVRPEAHEGMVPARPFSERIRLRRPFSRCAERIQEERDFISSRLPAEQSGSYPSQILRRVEGFGEPPRAMHQQKSKVLATAVDEGHNGSQHTKPFRRTHLGTAPAVD
jgi:hypothetical protein